MKTIKQRLRLCGYSFFVAASLFACSTPRAHGLADQKNQSTSIQTIQAIDRLRIILYSDECFNRDAGLLNTCSQSLRRLLPLIVSYGHGPIQIVGYTDDVFDAAMAQQRSQCQADSVRAYLCSLGISPRRLQAIGYGDHDSLASNRSIAASAANRRVEIRLAK